MTKLDIEGAYEGIKGLFKLRTSFPVKLTPCETHVDKLKTKKFWTYVDFHGEKTGPASMKRRRVRRK